jgi:hypothetical protein
MQVTIYVHIPEDEASKPVQAEKIGQNLYRILPADDYDPEDAEWEFPPGSIVRCEEREYDGMRYLQAVEKGEGVG